MYVISSLVLESSTPYTTHLRLLLPVMYVISSLVLVSDVSIVESFVIFYRV